MNELDLSPNADNLLLTAGNDGGLAVWDIPLDGLSADITSVHVWRERAEMSERREQRERAESIEKGAKYCNNLFVVAWLMFSCVLCTRLLRSCSLCSAYRQAKSACWWLDGTLLRAAL